MSNHQQCPNVAAGIKVKECCRNKQEIEVKQNNKKSKVGTGKTFCVLATRFNAQYLFRFSCQKSLFLFAYNHPVRKMALRAMTHQYPFSLSVIIGTIFVNMLLLAMNKNFAIVDLIFTGIYTLEVIIKVLSRGFALHSFSYLRNPWNWLDFTVVLLAYLTLAFPKIPGLSALRAFRALKMIAILPGLKTIIGAIFKSARLLMEVLLLMMFVLLIIALFGLQIFKGVLTHKCIKDLEPGINITHKEWGNYIQNKSNWLVTEDVDTMVCGNGTGTGRCPTNFTCIPGIGFNPNNGYTNFDNIGWALITAFQLITLDYWENTYNLVLRASGAYYIIFFIVVVMFGAHYIVNLVLAVVAASYEKEAKRKQEAKEEEERILELRRQKALLRTKGSNLNPKERFRQCGRRLTRGFSVDSVISWATEISQLDEDEETEKQKNSKCYSFKKRLRRKFCSWTCCPTFLRLQEYLVIIVSHPLFEGVITICILINTLLLSIDYHRAPYSHALESGNTVLSIIFIIEAILKVTALNPMPYVRNGWNAFDFIIVLLTCLEWVLSAINIPTLKLSMIRSLRMLRVFKLAKNWKTLNILINIIFKSLKEMGNLTLIVIIVIYIFTVIGMQLVGHDYENKEAFDGNKIPRWNFRGFYNSFIMVFRILCGEWIEPLYDCMRCSKMYFCLPLFLLTYIAGNFLVLNLFLALLLNFFSGDTLTANTKEEKASPYKDYIKNFLLLLTCRKPNKPSLGKIQPDEQKDTSEADCAHPSNDVPLSECNTRHQMNVENEIKSSSTVEPTALPTFSHSGVLPPVGKSEVPTVSALCDPALSGRKYENGSAVLMLETVEEVQQETEIELHHPAVDMSHPEIAEHLKDKHISEDNKAEDEKHSCSIEDEVLEDEELKAEVKTMQPCLPTICTGKCNCCNVLKTTFMAELFLSLRTLMFKVVNNRVFDGSVLFVILLSTITLTLDDKYLQKNAKVQLALQYLDYFYAFFFNFEMIVKVLGLGLTDYFTNVWTLLDFFLVVIGWLSMLGNSIQAFKSLRSFRTLRALRPLRAISRWEGMRLVVNALVASIPSISNVMFVCLVFWLIFGIVGVQIFGGAFFQCVDENDKRLPISIINNRSECDAYRDIGYQWVNPKINFDNVLAAYMALLQVATFEGWLEIMANAADTRGIDLQPEMGANPYSLFYFVAFIVIGTFFTLNLFIGIIIDNFNTMHKRSRKEGALVTVLTEDQRRFYGTLKRLSKTKPVKKIPTPKNKILFKFYKLVSHKWFEPFTIALITLNVLVMACDHYGQTKMFALVLNWFNLIFAALFTVEAILKLLGQRQYYFTQAWNIFDFLVVVLSLVGILLDSSASKKQGVSPTILRVFRIVRLARLLRLVRSLKGIRKLLFTLVISIPALFNIGLLLGLVMFIYSILGMSLFRDLPRESPINDIVNFETFGNSMMLLFRLTTAAAWNEILHVMINSPVQRQFVSFTYMTSYILVANIVIINMYVAVILENFHEAQEQELAGVTDEDVDMFYEVWSNYDVKATQFITYEQLPDFLNELKSPLRIPKPNAVKVAALNLPLTDGNRLHCLDVLEALSAVIVGKVAESEPLKKLSGEVLKMSMKVFPIRSTMERITTTLMIRKEFKAALTIQKAFRKWQVRRYHKTAKAKLERSYSSLRKSLRSLRSSRPNSPLT
ncbi:sodium channel protein 1 brain-like [Heterodontus francisci]|uniref:sodium channel protein 1 brain-like n=1 Tax=Heterodontus francisci TaxID=7792 RepID=UPI00355BB636